MRILNQGEGILPKRVLNTLPRSLICLIPPTDPSTDQPGHTPMRHTHAHTRLSFIKLHWGRVLSRFYFFVSISLFSFFVVVVQTNFA